MGVSRSPGRTPRNASRTLVRDWLPADRYDAILAAIPLLYAVALAGHVVFDLPIQAALLPASLVGMALLIDAIYLHPPTADGPVEADADASAESSPDAGAD